MECRTIKGIQYCVYDTEEEFREHEGDVEIHENWRSDEATEGSWVKSDDSRIVQLLRKREAHHHHDCKYILNKFWVRTVVGTFLESMNMDTDFSKHPNRYSFGGKRISTAPQLSGSCGVVAMERKFVTMLLATGDPYYAYRVIRPQIASLKRLHMKVSNLLRSPRVLSMMKEEVREAATKVGVTPEYILQKLKDVADDELARPKDIVAACKELGAIIDIRPKMKTTTRKGLLQSIRGVITPGEIDRVAGQLTDGQQQVAVDTIGIEEETVESSGHDEDYDSLHTQESDYEEEE